MRCLQATALGLGLVTVGAFDDDAVKRIVSIPPDEGSTVCNTGGQENVAVQPYRDSN